IGGVIARNLLRAGFQGPVMPVNPKYEAVEGVLTYPDVGSLPVVPDLAVIATPPETVPEIVAQLGRHGTRGAVVITAGFGEGGAQRGRELQQAMLEAARPHTLRIIGPNCVGILVPQMKLNASFSHLPASEGRIAFVTQSGAIVTSVLDWARPRGIGFSHLVSLGDMADVDFGDMLDYLADDPKTSAILLYVEGITHARKFMSAARAASRMKPVIVVKAGRHEEGARAAASHTGALAGSDDVYEAAFRRAGMLRVTSLEDLFAAVETLAMTEPMKGDRLAILTNGGGMGVLAVDALIDEGGTLATLSPETRSRLDAALPPTWSHGNPIDIVGDAGPERYSAALQALLGDPGVDAVLVLNCPTAVASSIDCARAVVEIAPGQRPGRILTSWVGEATADEARRLFGAQGVPAYETPGQAVRSFMHMVRYSRSQEMLMETPPSIPEEFSPDLEAARRIVDAGLGAGGGWLSEPDAKALVGAYGIAVTPTRIATTPEEAAAASAEIDGPVALKILSPTITHKTDVGGVALDLAEPRDVGRAAAEMLDRVSQQRPEARLEGFSVQPMVRRPGAHELIVGMKLDEQFGPVLLFGQGGTAVELLEDTTVGLPPLNMRLAQRMISRTRISRLFAGYRGQPGVDRNALCLTLIRVSQLVIDFPEILELDLNPVLADHAGSIALDARVKLGPTRATGTERLAIRPYPQELEETVSLGDGRQLWLRPILPEDEPALQASFAKLTPEEVRMRFFTSMKTLSHMMAARFTQLDYDREMALILTERGVPGTRDIYGVVRLISDPDNEQAEFAVIVRHEMTGLGLGVLLMRRIIDYARARGTSRIWGDVLPDNRTMRKLCKALGFRERHEEGEMRVVRVTLDLDGPDAPR
ncbi:MAG: GNAT family N-acetyltransferase, partial [Myxococcota bacterium]